MEQVSPLYSEKSVYRTLMTVIAVIGIVWTSFLLLYHFVIGIVYFAWGMFGYAVSDVLMIVVHIFMLINYIIGLIAVVNKTIHIALRTSLTKYFGAIIHVGIHCVTVLYLFIWTTEFGYSSYMGTFVAAGANSSNSGVVLYLHASMGLIWFIANLILGIAGNASMFLYYGYFDAYRISILRHMKM